jgi:hypothetical protein
MSQLIVVTIDLSGQRLGAKRVVGGWSAPAMTLLFHEQLHQLDVAPRIESG